MLTEAYIYIYIISNLYFLTIWKVEHKPGLYAALALPRTRLYELLDDEQKSQLSENHGLDRKELHAQRSDS